MVLTGKSNKNFTQLKRLLKPVIILGISVAVGLFPGMLWLRVLNTHLNDSFLGSLPALLVYPGYKLAAFLFPELAHNESAGLTLLPASLAINFGFYFLISFCSCLLIARLWSKRRT